MLGSLDRARPSQFLARTARSRRSSNASSVGASCFESQQFESHVHFLSHCEHMALIEAKSRGRQLGGWGRQGEGSEEAKAATGRFSLAAGGSASVLFSPTQPR